MPKSDPVKDITPLPRKAPQVTSVPPDITEIKGIEKFCQAQSEHAATGYRQSQQAVVSWQLVGEHWAFDLMAKVYRQMTSSEPSPTSIIDEVAQATRAFYAAYGKGGQLGVGAFEATNWAGFANYFADMCLSLSETLHIKSVSGDAQALKARAWLLYGSHKAFDTIHRRLATATDIKVKEAPRQLTTGPGDTIAAMIKGVNAQLPKETSED